MVQGQPPACAGAGKRVAPGELAAGRLLPACRLPQRRAVGSAGSAGLDASRPAAAAPLAASKAACSDRVWSVRFVPAV